MKQPGRSQYGQQKWYCTGDLQLHLRERAKPPAKSSEIQQQRPGTAKQGEANKMQISLAPNPQTHHTSRGIKSKSGSRPRTIEAEPAAPTSIRRRAAARRGERSRAGPPVRAAASRGEALLPRRRLGRRAGALPPVQLGAHPGPPVPQPAARHLSARPPARSLPPHHATRGARAVGGR